MIRTIISMLFAFACTHFVIAQQPDTSYLNQYDEQGNKHGQWVEEEGYTRQISNYNHGKLNGVILLYNKAKDKISLIEILDNDEYKSLILFDDDGRPNLICLDFVKVDTLLNAKHYAPNLHANLRFKAISFHDNGVIERESLEYLPDNEDVLINSIRVGVEKVYNDKGELIEIIQHE